MKHLRTYECMLDEGIHAQNASNFTHFFYTKIQGVPGAENLCKYDLMFVKDGLEYRRFEHGEDRLFENILCMLHGTQKGDRIGLGFEYAEATEQDNRNFDVLVKKFLGCEPVEKL